MATSRSSSATDAPCHATGTTRLDGPARMAPRALPHSRCAHSTRFRGPRAPSIDESPGEPALSRAPSDGRHCYPCLAASVQLPGTPFAVTSCPLDPPSLGSSPRSKRAACRPSTSAVEMILEHTSGRTKPRHSRDGKPPQVGRQQRSRAPRPRTCARNREKTPKPHQRLGCQQVRGQRSLPVALSATHPSDRSPRMRLTPTRSTQTPVSPSRDAGRMEARPATPVR